MPQFRVILQLSVALFFIWWNCHTLLLQFKFIAKLLASPWGLIPNQFRDFSSREPTAVRKRHARITARGAPIYRV